MTYFGFLLRFLGIPLVLLAFLHWRDMRRGRSLPPALQNLPAWVVVMLHVVIAVVYTTPWDNYLVATRVWWYDPQLVTGITLGWVPLEEYTFFVLQTLLTSLWLLWLARRLPYAAGTEPLRPGYRISLIVPGLLWAGSLLLLASSWRSTTYLALILVWAVPPLLLQLGFGSAILLRHGLLVLVSILVPTLYLALADTLAIRAGTWTINPEQMLGLHLPGGLPVEEALFFLMTNILVSFGVVLALAEESAARFKRLTVHHVPF